ncbi:hypothetical protein B0H13DRAFT_1618853 [Mycena leptocephala]|nr:hypothetical protein B0H13DRAFT_1618853 [Mycena leptocephala]
MTPSKSQLSVPLGPFDGKVGAVVTIEAESYLITTHAPYIPAVPIRPNHTVFIREDMRYGEDDPTLWPQNFSAYYCHLAAIHRKPIGAKREVAIMWWDPSPDDFISRETGLTVTRGLGKLKSSRLAQLTNLIEKFCEEQQRVGQGNAELRKVDSLMGPLVQQLRLGLERLQTLPSTFTQMVVAVTALQRTYLEADALLRYMTHYKPLLDASGSGSPPPPLDHCVGAFVSKPEVAQRFRAAGLPYWYIRPAWTFGTENILEVVEPRQPAAELRLEAAAGSQHYPTKKDTDSKINIIHKCSETVPWYKDPFATPEDDPMPSSSVSPAAAPPATNPRAHPEGHPPIAGAGGARGGRGGASRGARGGRGGTSRGARGGASRGTSGTGSNASRNKFEPLNHPEMPPSIWAWEDALKNVDRSTVPHIRRPSDSRYVFPEPALVVSSEDPARRQVLLHHLSLMMDALIFRLGDPKDRHELLSSQEWRDVLQGKAVPPQDGNHRGGQTKAGKRSLALSDLLAPALRACGVTAHSGIPATAGTFPPMTTHRAQELLWAVAETNFRYEFLALDRRASGLYRPERCRECFAGGMLVGMPVELAKQGLASLSLLVRHPFVLSIARLMGDWRGHPRWIDDAKTREAWDDDAMNQLEVDVSYHYTQMFYDLFGRAAVVPMRIVHEFGA